MPLDEGMSGELNGYLAVRVAILGDRRIVYKNASKIHTLIRHEIY